MFLIFDSLTSKQKFGTRFPSICHELCANQSGMNRLTRSFLNTFRDFMNFCGCTNREIILKKGIALDVCGVRKD